MYTLQISNTSFVGMKTYPSKWHSARDAQRSTVGSSSWAGLVVDWEVVGLTVDSEHEHCELQGGTCKVE